MLMFKKKADLFRLNVDALVNPVNCVGVMGAGLAKEFKERFPACFEPYKLLCDEKKLKLGTVEVVESGVPHPKWIILFPTKDDFREKSNYTSIERGLLDMEKECDERGFSSVGIPAIGCGFGGLKWDIVRSIIVRELSSSTIRYIVTEPVHTTEV